MGGPRGCALLVVALWANRAAANPIEVLGLTSRHAAQANAGIAAVDDAAALYYDPAGLVADPTLALSIGTIAAYSHLAGDRARRPSPLGAQLAMRAPLPIRGRWGPRIVVGIAVHLLPRELARVTAPGPDEPYYPYYGDRLSRVVVLPGAAVRLGDFAIGASLNVLAGMAGTIEASEGATRALDARVDLVMSTVARVIAGATWQATPRVRLAAVYRQRFELPFQAAARTTVAGEPIDLDLRAAGQFTPHQLALGVAWRGVALDVGYARWSGYPGPYVRVDSRLPLVGPVPGQPPRVPFEDTLGVRLGLEAHRARWTARGGYAFETSPVPARQSGVTNLLDGPRHTVAAGAGFAARRVAIDVHVQLQLVGDRTITKALHDGSTAYDPFTSIRDDDLATAGTQTTNPGYPSLHGGGQVVSAGLTVTVRR